MLILCCFVCLKANFATFVPLKLYIMDYIQSYTKHIVVRGIRIMAVFMLIGGIVLCIHSNHKAWDVACF